MSSSTRYAQRLLAGMPARRPPLSVHTDPQGRQVVIGDRAVVLFGPFAQTDLGARNVAIVSVTQMGFAVADTAAAFGLRPGTVSELRTAFHRQGAAGIVKTPGRPSTLDEDARTEIRALQAQGFTQVQIAAKYQVSQSAVSQALTRHRAEATTTTEDDAPEDTQDHTAEDDPRPDPLLFDPADEPPPAPTATAEQDDDQEQTPPVHDTDTDQIEEGQAGADPTQAAPRPRITSGTFESRYAGAMLAHAYLDRAGAAKILTGLGGAVWRIFDQAQITTFTVLSLLTGANTVEAAKTLIPAHAGPLIGATSCPSLDVLRRRLGAIADTTDIPALQIDLAIAMLATDGRTGGIFYVDDHFVPYTGAKPVAMGHNSKRDRCEKGRADTLVTDARGRAVCFTSSDPTHLSKTMKPALAQLRQIIPTGPILLGFDRGGAYAEAFTACHDLDIDFVTYRRGPLAPTTATPTTHHIQRGRKKTTVILADEQITFKDYTGPCRQLSLYEPTPDCTCPHPTGDTTGDPTGDPTGDQGDCPHLTLVLQVLTSDLTASAPDLLFALKGRWIIENTFKYLDFYGIDWLVDYHADITTNTKLIDNPARKDANTAIRAAKTTRDEAHRALGALLTADLTIPEKNTAIPAARHAITTAEAKIKELTTARDKIPVQLPADVIDPTARRAKHRTHRRGLLMALRLLAYNTDIWLADHLDIYLQDPDEYRTITRSLMHHPGTITYTPDHITVTLDAHHAPRINRALTLLLDELNTTPAHTTTDPRPITYQLAT